MDGRVLLNDRKDKGWVYVEWILLVHYRDQWWAVVRTVMNIFWRYKIAGMSWLVRKLSASRETLLRGACWLNEAQWKLNGDNCLLKRNFCCYAFEQRVKRQIFWEWVVIWRFGWWLKGDGWMGGQEGSDGALFFAGGIEHRFVLSPLVLLIAVILKNMLEYVKVSYGNVTWGCYHAVITVRGYPVDWLLSSYMFQRICGRSENDPHSFALVASPPALRNSNSGTLERTGV